MVDVTQLQRDFLMVDFFSSLFFWDCWMRVGCASHFLFSLDFLPRKKKQQPSIKETRNKSVHGMKSETPKSSFVEKDEKKMKECEEDDPRDGWRCVRFLGGRRCSNRLRFLFPFALPHRHPQYLILSSIVMGWDNNIISVCIKASRRREDEIYDVVVDMFVRREHGVSMRRRKSQANQRLFLMMMVGDLKIKQICLTLPALHHLSRGFISRR